MEYIPYAKGELEGRLQPAPQYEFVMRRAGQLVCGEMVSEPVLGSVRVSAVTRMKPPFVQIAWADEHGPSTAAGRYRADQPFTARVPGPVDRLRIRRDIDRADWLGRPISTDTARRIAAHLHRGPTSALYGFVVDGGITEQFFQELDQIQADQPVRRPWVQALARYGVSREDLGPLPGSDPTDSFDEPDRPNGQTAAKGRRCRGRHPVVLVHKQIRTDLAVRLIDAAYALGVAAGRAEGITTAAQRPTWAAWMAGVERQGYRDQPNVAESRDGGAFAFDPRC
jgi:hypothetical protein